MINHKSQKLTDSFYCYQWTGMGNNCNASLLVGVLAGKHPHILVDPGHRVNQLGEACFESLSQAMEKDGFGMADIGLVIGTHCHPDHFEAVEAVIAESGALLAISREEDEFYAETGIDFYDFFGSRAPRVKPSFYIAEGELSLETKNELHIEALLTPGHTPGSVSLYLEAAKILISGDVVFDGGVGRTDFPGGDSSLLRKSIERLSQLEVEYLVMGHSGGDGAVLAGKDRVAHNFKMVRMFV
jgi:hydroxyacylglutathione hydrolase